MDRDRLILILGGVGLLLLLSLCVWLFRLLARQRLKVVEAWRAFGAEHGLAFSLDSLGRWPILEGRFEGVAVRLQMDKRGVDHATYHARYEASFGTPLPEGLWIDDRQKTHVPRREEVQTGDAELDRSLRVAVANREGLGLLLRARELRAAILAFVRDSPRSCIHSVASHGATILGGVEESDPALLAERLRVLAAFVRSVDAAPRG